MARLHRVARIAFSLAIGTRAVHAQAAPTSSLAALIEAKVYVTLSDDRVPYAPVARHRLRAVRAGEVAGVTTADSIDFLTDDAGIATVSLPAGDYRIVSLAPADWRGHRYQWLVPMQVRQGMEAVNLTVRNAVVDQVSNVVAMEAGNRGVSAEADLQTLAGLTPGTRVRVRAASLGTRPVTGVVANSARDTLFVTGKGTFVWQNHTFAVPINSITVLETGSKNRLIGFGVGAALGIVTGLAVPAQNPAARGASLAASVVGGALAGLAFPVEIWHQVPFTRRTGSRATATSDTLVRVSQR